MCEENFFSSENLMGSDCYLYNKGTNNLMTPQKKKKNTIEN